jgi:hypothetical protein
VLDSRLEPEIEDAKWDDVDNALEAGGGIRGNGVTKFVLTCARRVALAVELGDKGVLEDDGRVGAYGVIRVGGGDADAVEPKGDLPGRGVNGFCKDFPFECLDRTPPDEGETVTAGDGTSMRMLSLRLEENPEPLLDCRALPRFFLNSSPNNRSSSSTVTVLFRASRT